MIRPRVTVITVCRNAVNLIERTVLSVLHQDYDNIEYIVIDGASTDGTCDIIQKYSDSISVYITEPDKGIYDAMNKGLKLATGDWISFMNAGDRFCTNNVILSVFSTFSAIPSSDTYKVIGGDTRRIYSDRFEIVHADGVGVLPCDIPYCHQSTFTKRKLFSDDSFQFDTKYSIAADFNLIYQVYQKFSVKAFCTLNITIADYLMDGSTSFDNLRKTQREYLQISFDLFSLTWWKKFAKYLLKR